jgi:hypothetical protein
MDRDRKWDVLLFLSLLLSDFSNLSYFFCLSWFLGIILVWLIECGELLTGLFLKESGAVAAA